MHTVTLEEARFIPAQPHRPGGVSFHHLLAGREGRPDNYSLSLVRVHERYEAVRHRHNFEQVRILLEGSFGYGPGAVQEAGSVGYFCEGIYYTQLGVGPSLTLLLQCGGPSGESYMSFDQLQRGIAELSPRGRFAEGLFTPNGATVSGRTSVRPQDGYEAIWEHVNGRKIHYTEPRFDAPVLMRPDNFGWLDVGGFQGVALQPLASLHERGLGLARWRFAPGASIRMAPASRIEILFVSSGDIHAGGRQLAESSAVEVLPGEAPQFQAGGRGAVLFGFSLPSFATV